MYVLDRLKNWTFLSASLVPACSSLSLSVVGKFCLTRLLLFKNARPRSKSQLQSRLAMYSLLEPSTTAPKPLVKTAARLTAAAFLVNCCLGMSRRMRTKLDKLDTQTQLTPSQSTRYTEGGVRTSRRPHKAAKAAGTQSSPKCVNYNLVNEQEQSQPQRIHARHQGTQSPQISITLGTLSQPATDLTQRSSPEGSLVHALDCPHLGSSQLLPP